MALWHQGFLCVGRVSYLLRGGLAVIDDGWFLYAPPSVVFRPSDRENTHVPCPGGHTYTSPTGMGIAGAPFSTLASPPAVASGRPARRTPRLARGVRKW